MPKEIIEEKDDDTSGEELHVVEVDELPKSGETSKAATEGDADDKDPKGDKSADGDGEEDDEDDEDRRLSAEDREDDDDDGEDNPQRRKRLKRRQMQRRAKERTLEELRLLRQIVEEQGRQLAGLSGAHLQSSESQIEDRLAAVRQDIRQAEAILAKAIEAGNGEDAATAMRLRDEAKDAERDLLQAKSGIEEAKKPRPGKPDPRVVELAGAWKKANASWYGQRGHEEETAIANAIDSRLISEGYDPTSVEYYEELTHRVRRRFGGASEEAEDRRDPPKRKKAPPLGGGREHAPPSTRREVFVTPERKAAMIVAGVWDDPVKRARYLKAYSEYDRRSAG